MYFLMVAVFVLGYLAIALEHPLRIDKAASALLIGAITWAIFAFGIDSIAEHSPAFADFIAHEGADADKSHFLSESLLHHLSEIASILFFLMGAMTIVELIDAHEGFAVITDRIKTSHKVTLLWVLSVLTFFLSAALDNLTTAIVMSA